MGVALGVADGVSSGVAVGEGDSVGLGVGEDFFFFDFDFPFAFGLALGSGVGEVFRCFFGDGDDAGVGLFFASGCLWCLRAGVGVGVAKNFLIFSPNDSSAPMAGAFAPKPINKSRKTRSDVFKLAKCRLRTRVPAKRLCSCAFRLRDSREENSR